MGNTSCCQQQGEKDLNIPVYTKYLQKNKQESKFSEAPKKSSLQDIKQQSKVSKISNNNEVYSHDNIKQNANKSSLRSNQKQSQIIIKINENQEEKNITIPKLHPNIEKHLNQQNFLKQKLSLNPQKKKFGEQIYVGTLNHNKKPDGYGKMYKSDGSYFVGKFSNGKANGEGAYFFVDGSYYEGEFVNNSANSDNGYYYSQQFEYNGGFKDNKFHGKGKQSSRYHTFVGEFVNGLKIKGTYEWEQDDDKYKYVGQFNKHGQFYGKGILTDPKGVYEGEFLNGMKHGQGVYKYENGLKYEGSYEFGERQGKGIIYNMDNKIAYEGEFKKGSPHGTGYVYNNGKKQKTKWVEGIDSRLLS